MRIYIEFLGCRLNAAEAEALARRFAGMGADVVTTPEEADVILLNTCAVTAQAARKSRHRLRALHRRNPEAQVAAVGCWVTDCERRHQTATDIAGVTWAIPNVAKAQAVAIIMSQMEGDDVIPSAAEGPKRSSVILSTAEGSAPWVPGRWGHTRAFLGVQEGCDYACTYCITRVLRGPARSLPVREVVKRVTAMVQHGAQEVVLTGVCLGAYGQDLGLSGGLGALVAAILQDTDVPRLRLSSVEPWDVDAHLLEQVAHPRLCRQLHLPLQSGSDTVLRRMGRRIDTATFAQVVADARAVSPDVAVTTDLIAGFPGETEADFEATLAFVERMAFARLHVFPYSERQGTAAVRLSKRICAPRTDAPRSGAPRVPKRVRAERAARLRDLGRTLKRAYHERFLGQVLPVLWERAETRAAGDGQAEANDDGQRVWRGLTDNYLAVKATSKAQLYNKIVPARLLAYQRGVIKGELAGGVV
jgi:threonylcarbamoyladenosine tRNA methylthiotransferase MtaB